MPQVTNRPGEMQDAVKKSNKFCETVFKHVITTVAVYGKLLKQEAGETGSVDISGVYVKPPKTALNHVAQRLRDLAAQFSMNLENLCSVDDITRCLKLASTNTTSANVLIKASFDIFQSYEKHLMSVDEDDLRGYAKLVCEKILKAYVSQMTDPEFTEKFITAAVFSDKYSNKYIVQCCYGEFIDAAFKIEPNVSMSKFDKYLTKAGIFHDGILYERVISKSAKYYFRRLFDAETENLREFNVNNRLNINYKYILSEPLKQTCFQELMNHFARIRLQEIDFKTEVEAKIANFKDEIKTLKKNYRLKYMEELIDSIDNLDSSVQKMNASNSGAATEATSRNEAGISRSQPNIGFQNNVTAAKIGSMNQNLRY